MAGVLGGKGSQGEGLKRTRSLEMVERGGGGGGGRRLKITSSDMGGGGNEGRAIRGQALLEAGDVGPRSVAHLKATVGGIEFPCDWLR